MRNRTPFLVIAGAMMLCGAGAAGSAVKCPGGSLPIPNSSGKVICVNKSDWDRTRGWAGCAAQQIPIPDERHDVSKLKFLCMSGQEWARAKTICAKLKSPALECTCQDGNSVGACGD
jgi:hypothetical protein